MRFFAADTVTRYMTRGVLLIYLMTLSTGHIHSVTVT